MDDEVAGDVIENLAMKELGQDLLARLTIGGSLIRSLVDLVSERIRSSPEGGEIDEATVEELASEWVQVGGLEEFAPAFGSERIVTFGNPAGLYEHWGLQRAIVAGRGLILDFGDLDSDPDIRVWGTFGNRRATGGVRQGIRPGIRGRLGHDWLAPDGGRLLGW